MLVKGRGKRGKYWNKEEEGTRTTVQVQRKKECVCLDCDGAFEREIKTERARPKRRNKKRIEDRQREKVDGSE